MSFLISSRIFDEPTCQNDKIAKIIGCGADSSDSRGSNSTLWVDCDFLNTRIGYENNYLEPQYFTGCTFNGTPPISDWNIFLQRSPDNPENSEYGKVV